MTTNIDIIEAMNREIEEMQAEADAEKAAKEEETKLTKESPKQKNRAKEKVASTLHSNVNTKVVFSNQENGKYKVNAKVETVKTNKIYVQPCSEEPMTSEHTGLHSNVNAKPGFSNQEKSNIQVNIRFETFKTQAIYCQPSIAGEHEARKTNTVVKTRDDPRLELLPRMSALQRIVGWIMGASDSVRIKKSDVINVIDYDVIQENADSEFELGEEAFCYNMKVGRSTDKPDQQYFEVAGLVTEKKSKARPKKGLATRLAKGLRGLFSCLRPKQATAL